MSSRALALDLVLEWQKSSRLADDLVNRRLDRDDLGTADRALVQELFYGWLRHRTHLGQVIDGLVARPPRREIQVVLELAALQCLVLDRIPPHAAVNEAVALAKRRTTPAEANFVNAVLRRLTVNREAIRENLAAVRERDPWVYYSHPQWLWERWVARWGDDRTAALCDWNNRPPPVFARINTLKTSATADVANPPGADPDQDRGLHPLCRAVADPGSLLRSEAWQAGWYYIQDPSTLLAVDLLDPQPGDEVLDVCAAPGGKTTYLAQKMENRGQIIAADTSNHRLGRVAENCRRLGVEIVATLPCNGTHLDRCLRGSQYDRVLVDAPCSNTGVMRRRPDLRWRLAATEIRRLAALQLQLLRSAATFVRPGGRLVYSTCSLEQEENEDVVAAFVADQAGLEPETTRALFPPEAGMDGAFVAVFRRAN